MGLALANIKGRVMAKVGNLGVKVRAKGRFGVGVEVSVFVALGEGFGIRS
jgi:hypothetical protein